MSHLAAILDSLVQSLRALVSRAAPILAAPARLVYAGPAQGWIMPPGADLPRLPGPVWTLLWLRLDRLAVRFARLYARWQAGTLPRPRTRPSTSHHRTTPTRPAPAHRPARPPARILAFPMPGVPLVEAPSRLPRGHGWVIRRLPACATEAGRLHDLLHITDMPDFIAAVPQAGRLLRPLCTALGVAHPDWLRLPPRPRRPRPRPARPPRARPLPLTHPDLKLPPYVIRAARYFIKKYGRDG